MLPRLSLRKPLQQHWLKLWLRQQRHRLSMPRLISSAYYLRNWFTRECTECGKWRYQGICLWMVLKRLLLLSSTLNLISHRNQDILWYLRKTELLKISHTIPWHHRRGATRSFFWAIRFESLDNKHCKTMENSTLFYISVEVEWELDHQM